MDKEDGNQNRPPKQKKPSEESFLLQLINQSHI